MSNFSFFKTCEITFHGNSEDRQQLRTTLRLCIASSSSMPVLDARTLAKVQVKKYATGGNCTCSDHGGCLFSDEGPWNDPDIKEKIQESSTIGDADSEGETMDKLSENASANPKENSGKIVITLEKYTALKTAVKDSQKKIEMLEVSLHETKKVLKGLVEIIKPIATEANL